METAPAHGRFTVDAWVVDPEAHEIIRGHHTVRLEPRVMRLLVALAERAGNTVTRHELFRIVWDGEHVEPNALNRSVSQLRKAFGDDAREPRIVRTIPRRGYRLDAAVSLRTTPTANARSDRRTPRSRLIAAALVGVVAAAAAVRPWSSDAVTPLPTRPVTSLMGLETWPALSPDGEQLAFVWGGDQSDRPGLYVQRIADGSRQIIADTGGVFASPVWSPDGGRVAYLATGPERCTVMTWSPMSGATVLVTCAPGTRPGLAWSPDQEQLALAEPDDAREATGIVLVSTVDGTRRRVTAPPSGTLGDGEPTFGPTGTRLAFTRYRSRTHHDIHVVNVGSGAIRRLTRDDRFVAGHAWNGDGSSIVFSSSRSGNFRLWQVPSVGGTPRWLNTIGTYDPGRPTVAGRGSRLAYSEWDFEYNIWVMSERATGNPTRVIASTRWDRQPQWSPDGRSLVFVSDRTGNDELWWSRADGSEPTRLTGFGDRPVSSPHWSPDGRHVAFHITGDSGTDVYTLTLGQDQPLPVAASDENEEGPTWSGDGRHILFASDRSGRWETYRVSVADRAIEQLSTGGGYFAREGPDGRVLATRFAQPGLWLLPSAGTATPHRLPIELAAEDWGNWVVDERGDVIVVDRRDASGSAIVRVSPHTGERIPLFTTARAIPFGAGQFSVRTDGMLAYSQTDRAESDIRLVEGFGVPPS
jgi:Tol biopolymer transport system component/DNA-binding winged helix-turn-helix (wHTH) protein